MPGMSDQQPLQETPAESLEQEASAPFISDCHQVALDKLAGSFAEARPLAILIGEGKSGTRFVIGNFLANLGGDVVAARITQPCADTIDGMREVIRGIGFDPKDMNLADLENVFRMFLIFQKTHHRRTIVCFEEAQDIGPWVLDRVSRLVEMETKGKFGLMVVLSGRPALHDLLSEPPLNAIYATAGRRIIVAPFTLAETKEYVRRRVEAAGTTEIGQVFDFDAVTDIHGLSEGVPDAVSDLCSKCLEMADEEDINPVSAELVNRAAKLLELPSVMRLADVKVESEEGDDESILHGRLIAFMNGTVAHEQTLNGGHVLIGRDELCDIRLDSAPVSRHHALIVNSPRGVRIVDLASTNGCYVNGRKIKEQTLQDKDVINIGDCRIEYAAGDDHQSWLCDSDATHVFRPNITDLQPPVQGNDYDTQSPDPEGTAILAGLDRARR